MHGWQWLFLVQGLPTVLVGLVVLRFLPDSPAGVEWLNSAEKAWIADELARERRLIGGAVSHNVLAIFRNPKVLLNGAIGFTCIGAGITFTLSVPMILSRATGLDNVGVGYLVGLGGLIGTAATLWVGNRADRRGDRLIYAFGCSAVVAGALLAILLAPSPVIVGLAYIAFATVVFAVSMLVSSGWADALSGRELAVGAAAINTMSQIGAFLTPFAWGALADATGSFDAGLLGVVLMMGVNAALIWVLREQVRGPTRRAVPAAA
jgi:ACS family tartrate transporter-like MFS transporter